MASLNLKIITFNCARTLINASSFAYLILDPLFNNTLPPDILVLSLQEIAPIAHSFLGGSLLANYFDAFIDAVDITTQTKAGCSYKIIVAKNVGMTALMVFAKTNMMQRLQNIETAGVGVGVWDMGNKGAVGARIQWASSDQDVIYTTFVAAHLAPMEDAVQRRNEDWKNIVQNLIFTPGKAKSSAENVEYVREGEQQPLLPSDTAERSLYSYPGSRSYVFVAGDLNYRTCDTPPGADAYKSWPRPTATRSSPHHFSRYLSYDQLIREKNLGHTLHHFLEAPIDFPPTYKYEQSSNNGDGGNADNTTINGENVTSTLVSTSQRRGNARSKEDSYSSETWVWAKHRAPSWCDRILFLPSSEVHVQNYWALPFISSSDHRPVALAISISESNLPPVSDQTEAVQSPFAPNPRWEQRQAAARRRELITGLTLYLATTNEGRMILLATAAGLFAGALAIIRYLGQ
ncbi:MAG: hypothetical protein M1821_003098 [Bathelium mastoideum]|nr:MAG: hypothetical protein M1821_003098 [Bathelium mastoideum]KAI9688223.1 MAG: hypothetical protein M1822_001729 [Bathelium mastoideum]